jgi:hypothetical protein
MAWRVLFMSMFKRRETYLVKCYVRLSFVFVYLLLFFVKKAIRLLLPILIWLDSIITV